jgi:hypothetical protein
MNGNFEEFILKIELPVLGPYRIHAAKAAASLGPPS